VAANARVAADCPAFDEGVVLNSDILEIRRSSASTTDLAADTVQVKSNRNNSRIFSNGVEPVDFVNEVDIDGTFDYVFHTYYIARTSANAPNTPSLRRRTLVGTEVVDEEVISGVEDMQIQFGVDSNGDGSVNRYVDPDAAGFNADSEVIAVRIWLLMRSEYEELGQLDDRVYTNIEGAEYVPNDKYRRLEASKTIFLRNSRS
jgi:type IV pilus assembly protein PilW